MSNFEKVEAEYAFGELFTTTVTPAHRAVIGRNMPAQQYSSSTFVSLRFCVLKEKFGGRLTKLRISFFFYFLKIA